MKKCIFSYNLHQYCCCSTTKHKYDKQVCHRRTRRMDFFYSATFISKWAHESVAKKQTLYNWLFIGDWCITCSKYDKTHWNIFKLYIRTSWKPYTMSFTGMNIQSHVCYDSNLILKHFCVLSLDIVFNLLLYFWI